MLPCQRTEMSSQFKDTTCNLCVNHYPRLKDEKRAKSDMSFVLSLFWFICLFCGANSTICSTLALSLLQFSLLGLSTDLTRNDIITTKQRISVSTLYRTVCLCFENFHRNNLGSNCQVKQIILKCCLEMLLRKLDLEATNIH